MSLSHSLRTVDQVIDYITEQVTMSKDKKSETSNLHNVDELYKLVRESDESNEEKVVNQEMAFQSTYTYLNCKRKSRIFFRLHHIRLEYTHEYHLWPKLDTNEQMVTAPLHLFLSIFLFQNQIHTCPTCRKVKTNG